MNDSRRVGFKGRVLQKLPIGEAASTGTAVVVEKLEQPDTERELRAELRLAITNLRAAEELARRYRVGLEWFAETDRVATARRARAVLLGVDPHSDDVERLWAEREAQR